MTVNTYLDSEIEGLDSFVELGGADNFVDGFNALVALLKEEHTQDHRGHLDQISPAAHRQLIRELTYLQSLAPGFANGTSAVVANGDTVDDTTSANNATINVAAGVVTVTSVP